MRKVLLLGLLSIFFLSGSVFAAYSDTGASQQPTVAKASEYVKAGADILVIETGYDVENSVCNALDELGYTYDFLRLGVIRRTAEH
ncbi:MAG TPA: hypothetical protein ENF26_00220 [Methanomicrobia archaeon]|nr:hypothetical protein [Methanomicrobia archaeon]HEX58565.1 hypothetical protein [Methanomicrobia archaeon]